MHCPSFVDVHVTISGVFAFCVLREVTGSHQWPNFCTTIISIPIFDPAKWLGYRILPQRSGWKSPGSRSCSCSTWNVWRRSPEDAVKRGDQWAKSSEETWRLGVFSPTFHGKGCYLEMVPVDNLGLGALQMMWTETTFPVAGEVVYTSLETSEWVDTNTRSILRTVSTNAFWLDHCRSTATTYQQYENMPHPNQYWYQHPYPSLHVIPSHGIHYHLYSQRISHRTFLGLDLLLEGLQSLLRP